MAKAIRVWNGSSWEYVSAVQGPQGPKGDKGDIGETGPQGPTGAAGHDALSAYVHPAPSNPSVGDLWVDSSASPTSFDLPLSTTNGGMKAGGSTGQVLRKSSNSDYALEWVDLPTPVTLSPFLLMGA